jgi:hypothetical protein
VRDETTLRRLLVEALNEALPQAKTLQDDAQKSGAGYGMGIYYAILSRKISEHVAGESDPPPKGAQS